MSLTRPMNRLTSTIAAGLFALSTVSLAACAEEPAETDVEVAEGFEDDDDVDQAVGDNDEDVIYDGFYSTDFYDDIDSFDGRSVTLTGEVAEVLSPSSFTLAANDGTDVEDMLVVSAVELDEVSAAGDVSVSGTVHRSFDVTTVEQELGIDLDDERYEGWDGRPYLEASSVDATVADQ